MDKIAKSRYLRNNMTEQELKLWYFLRKKQIGNNKFRRQYPIGNYIVDFVCRAKNLVIEIDGGQHNTDENIKYDNERTQYLESRGFKVIRFWNNDIENNIEGVLDIIYQHLAE